MEEIFLFYFLQRLKLWVCGYIYRFKSVILLLKKKILSFSIQPFLTTISKTNQKFLGDLNDDCTSLLLVLLEEFSTQLSSLMLKQGKREELLERWKLKSASSSVRWLLCTPTVRWDWSEQLHLLLAYNLCSMLPFHCGLGFLMYMVGKTFPGWC